MPLKAPHDLLATVVRVTMTVVIAVLVLLVHVVASVLAMALVAVVVAMVHPHLLQRLHRHDPNPFCIKPFFHRT